MANPDLIKNYTAGGTINPYRIVKFGSNDGEVVQGAAATDLLIGVVNIPAIAVTGNRVDVVRDGLVLVEFGGTVARGAVVTSDANGKAVAAAPATGVNNRIIGYAEVSAVAGDIADILLEIGTLQG